jgi:hypothetical protein
VVQASIPVPASVVIQPSPATSVAVSAATDASIAAYLAAGEGMRILAGWVFVACLGLMLVVAIAWALGVLPVAVPLF